MPLPRPCARWGRERVGVILSIAAIAVGLVLGGVIGYWIGVTWRDNRRVLWAMAIVAFVLASVLNFAGQLTGRQWLAIGGLGLMAGIISGVKYGGFPDVRVWEKPAPGAEAPADAEGAPQDADAPPRDAAS